MTASAKRQLFPYNKIRSAVVGTIHYPPEGTFGPRVQMDVQLVLLHTGSLEVTIDRKKHALKPGHAAILKPGHQEFFSFDRNRETWHRWIAVHFENLTREEHEAFYQLPFNIPIPEELNRLTDMMLKLRADHAAHSDIMRSLGHSALQLYASELTRSKLLMEAHPSVLHVKNMIHDRFHEELALSDLAHDAGISPEHLVRLFRKLEKTTPMKYVWHYRVLRAVELLAHTGLTITEIAERCGFKTTFHFSRLIKKQTGSTPTEIRMSSWGR